MNDLHDLCASPEWAAFLHDEILPSVTRGRDLGRRMLEIGPGPGAATDWLRHRVDHLTAVECDPDLAARLADRFTGDGVVDVVTGDATALTFADDTFDSAGSFTMLHHVATVAEQNALFAQVHRVLRPGGVFVGSDSLATDDLHHFHEGDTYNPIEPGLLMTRLQTVGFDRVMVRADGLLTFWAYKPRPPGDGAEAG